MSYPLHLAHYRVLDTEICLGSDSEKLLALFDRDYGSFRTSGSGETADLVIHALINGPQGPGISYRRQGAGAAGLPSEGEQSLSGHPSPVHHAWQWVTQTLFDSLHRFLLLHAAVAVHHGRAVIIAGPPGAGKTTLALDLAAAGFTLYSDEICPLHRRTGRISPFPRSFWVVPGGEQGQAWAGSDDGKGGKRPMPSPSLADIKESDETAVPALLIILDPGPESSVMGRLVIGARDQAWRPLLKDLARLHPGIDVVRPDKEKTEFHIDYPRGKGLGPAIADLLETHRDGLLNVFTAETARPDFSRSPVLEPVAAHEAAYGLLPGLKQGGGTSGEERGAGSAVRLKELIELLANTACYRLTVGRLDEEAPLVRRLARDATGEGEMKK